MKKRLCVGSQRVSEFKLFSRKEREKMILANGMLADVSVKVFDGLNLETLRRTFQHEMKNVVREEVEASFQMKREASKI